MVKKACFKAPPSFIIKTMVDHSKALSEESADLWSLHEEARVGLAPGNFPAKQLEHIRSVFARLWKGINISMLEKGGNLLLYEPSSGACLQEMRSTGGQAEWVSGRMLQDDEYLRQGEMYLPRTGRVYSFKNPLASLNGMVEVAPGVVHEIRGPHTCLSTIWKNLARAHAVEYSTQCVLPCKVRSLSDIALAKLFGRFDPLPQVPLNARTAKKRAPEPLTCVVGPVLEPLKCRLVTKGPAEEYWLVKGLQKTLWAHVQAKSACSLIGRPISTTDISAVVEGSSRYFWVEQHFEPMELVSVDYEASTDHIEGGITMMCLSEAIDALYKAGSEFCAPGSLFRRVAESVLANHEIQYPEMGVGTPDTILQTRGQLMGSPLSFPILCAINLATYWCALEDYIGKRVPLRELPVRVNGDDMLFYAPRSFTRLWTLYRNFVGFRPSIGKNYISSSFAVLNSQLFSVRTDFMSFSAFGGKRPTWAQIEESPDRFDIKRAWRADVKWLQVPNWGLLVGQTKLSHSNGIVDGYSQSVHLMKDQKRAHLRWIHYNLDSVKRYTQNGLWNLFFQPEYGGVGLIPPPRSDVVSATPFQLEVAAYLKSLNAGVHKTRPKTRHYHVAETSVTGMEITIDRPGLSWIRNYIGPPVKGWMEEGAPRVWRPKFATLFGTSLRGSREDMPLVRPSSQTIRNVRQCRSGILARGLPSASRFEATSGRLYGFVEGKRLVPLKGCAPDMQPSTRWELRPQAIAATGPKTKPKGKALKKEKSLPSGSRRGNPSFGLWLSSVSVPMASIDIDRQDEEDNLHLKHDD
jgi:hypothetical protein